MAAGPQLLDVATGTPSNPYRGFANENAIKTTGGGSTAVANVNQTQQTNQSQVSSSSSLNTTPQALSALHSLIASLTDRPAISEEELNAKAPMPTPVYSPSGWRWYDPLSGRYMNQQEAQTLSLQRKADQQALAKQAGTIPGGTAEQQRQQGERTTEIQRSRQQQGAYSKEAATADAQHLVDKAIADALRAAEPGITLASEGAGASKSTFRANALQEAATRGGLEGAAQGAQLGVAYGQIFNQLEGILEQLTKVDPNGPTAMLLQALQTAKGIAQTGTSVSNTSGTTQTQGTTTTNTTENKAATEATVRSDNQPLGGVVVQPVSPAIPVQQPTNPYYAFSMGTNNVQTDQTPSSFNANEAYANLVDETAYED